MITIHTHEELIDHLNITGAIKSANIREAFFAIDRSDFVLPGTPSDHIYADHALSLHYGQTISQPSTVAFMLELLQPHKDDKILDVGSGSGWTSALLGHIVGQHGHVYGVEIIPELVVYGRNNVAKYHGAYVTITQAIYGEIGDVAHMPFDRILVSATGREISRALVAQLRIGGVMVMPVDNDIVRIYKRSERDLDVQKYGGFVFVPLIV